MPDTSPHTKPKTFSRLQFRIFSWFFILLLVLQCSTAYLVYSAIRDYFEQQSYAQIDAGKRLFLTEQTSRDKYLRNNIRTIAKDWAFRSAVGSADQATIASALSNHGLRINADQTIYISTEREDIIGIGHDTPLVQALDNTLLQEQQGKASFYLLIENTLLQVFVETVKAPHVLGWLIVAYEQNDAIAQHYKQVMAIDVSLVAQVDDAPVVLASSIKAENQAWLNQLGAKTNTMQNIRFNEQNILTKGFDLTLKQSSQNVWVVLSHPLSQLEKSFSSWWGSLILLLMIGSALAVALAYAIAQSIAKPVEKLLKGAKHVAEGDYSQNIAVNSDDELGKLGLAFNSMQLAISQREAEINYRTTHDHLTSLLNRHGFLDLVTPLLADDDYGIYTLEADNYQQVNETLGHHVGDLLLVELANRLQNHLPEHTLIARLSGGQFTFAISAQQGKSFCYCGHIHQALKPAFLLEGVQINVTATIGFSWQEHRDDTAEALLRQADVAMHQGQQAQAKTQQYNPESDERSVFRLNLLHEIREAVSCDRMQLYFQPKLQLKAGPNHHQITQVECLIRMRHSDGSMVFPDQFIPLAEQSGAIVDVTEWVIEAALKQAQQWQQQNIDLSLAVNVSAIDLTAGRLPKLLPKLLEKYQLDAKTLVLEITESAVAKDPEQAIEVMQTLKQQGFKLSIDDYGTGYSSLAQLKQIPAEELKIDRAFVQYIAENPVDPMIVKSTIDMGHGMGLSITAEGIEDEKALILLEQLQCDFAQGYFIARPMPQAEFNEWMQAAHYPVRKISP